MTVTTTPAEPVRALAPRYYLDGDHHALEMDRVFARTWQYACHGAEVAEKRTYKTFRIGDPGSGPSSTSASTARTNCCVEKAASASSPALTTPGLTISGAGS